MRGKVAEVLAAQAKPCPFCGEKLRAKGDHHGWWVAHASETGSCLAAFIQVHGEADLREWNTRHTETEA